MALGAVAAAAILIVCSGLIHLHLWGIAYRHVATLGALFLVQAVAALVLAVVLGVLVLRSWGVARAPGSAQPSGRGASGGRNAHHGRVEVTAPH